MNNVIQEHMSSFHKVPVVMQRFDFKQMFDGMAASEACGDIFEYGVQDDHLHLIHEANKEVVISVKTVMDKADNTHSQAEPCKVTPGHQQWPLLRKTGLGRR